MTDGRGKSNPADTNRHIFTVRVGDTWFGIAIENVRTVFSTRSITPVPLAPDIVAGLVNVRGEVLTAIDLRRSLDIAPASLSGSLLLVGIEHQGEQIGLMIDAAGEILEISGKEKLTVPVSAGPDRRKRSFATYKVGDRLIPLLDIQEILDDITTLSSQNAA